MSVQGFRELEEWDDGSNVSPVAFVDSIRMLHYICFFGQVALLLQNYSMGHSTACLFTITIQSTSYCWFETCSFVPWTVFKRDSWFQIVWYPS